MKVHVQKQSQPQREASLHPSLFTEHAIRNQVEQAMLHANAEGCKVETGTPAPTRFAHDFSRIPVHFKAPLNLQAKLAVNTPGDIHEQEADRIAERVTSTPELQVEHACACGGGCPTCHNKQAVHGHLQTKHVHTKGTGEIAASPLVHEVLRSSGQPLQPSTLAYMEPRFGHDFSHVRVHTDAQAAESAMAVQALAYTVGHDVVFGARQYHPETAAGKRLLAHELTHVVQQSVGVQTELATNKPGDQHEQESGRAALAISGDTPSAVSRQTGVTHQLMRQQEEKPGDTPKQVPVGPYILPEVVVTATRTYPSAVGTYNIQAVPDVTFVKVESGEELQRRMEILNQLAVKQFLEKERRRQGTISAAGTEVQQERDEQAQETLKKQFGEGWGTFFWWTRGGGQTGEDSPLWKMLPAARGFNRGYPTQAFPTQKLVYPDTRGTATPIEGTK